MLYFRHKHDERAGGTTGIQTKTPYDKTNLVYLVADMVMLCGRYGLWLIWYRPNLKASMEVSRSSARLGSDDCIARSIMVSAIPGGAGGGGEAVLPCARLHSPSLYGTLRSPTMLL